MQVYLESRTENSVTIGLKEANLTLVTPLMEKLYENNDVAMVRYIDEHPELKDRRIFVSMRNGTSDDAIEALKKAAIDVSEYFKLSE